MRQLDRNRIPRAVMEGRKFLLPRDPAPCWMRAADLCRLHAIDVRALILEKPWDTPWQTYVAKRRDGVAGASC
jgi:hypothetical protein